MPAPFAFHQQLGRFALASLNHSVAVPLLVVDSEQHRATFREGEGLVQNLSQSCVTASFTDFNSKQVKNSLNLFNSQNLEN